MLKIKIKRPRVFLKLLLEVPYVQNHDIGW